jgi:4-amino-4-deoxy-L-arabinose transferase-like glycosyltransferase
MHELPANNRSPQVSHPAAPASGITAFCERHYRTLALCTLLLAAFNLGFRLNREVVTTWDESLYATSAAEMVKSGNWLVTTFHGDVDYYNTKPPLNVWLIAASFKAFGINLLSMRLPSFFAALATVMAMQWWCRRCFNAVTALMTAVVLSTTFGFLNVHSARSGNPDAWLTLDIVLTVITLWSARTAPWRLVWLGPLAAVAFMLKGSAVLLPLLIALCVLAVWRVERRGVAALAAAVGLFLLPTGAWALARWRFDRWRFFDGLINYDFIGRITHPLEGHGSGPFYYLNILQKDHYDWLVTAAVLLVALAVSRRDRQPLRLPVDRDMRVLLGVWAGATLLVPTLMATKLPWYLNPFYPLFAVAVAATIAAGFDAFSPAGRNRERVIVATMVLLAFGIAESKLIWYSYQRDLDGSMQAFFIKSPEMVEGRRVLLEEWDPADHFVLTHIANGQAVTGNPEVVASGVDEHDLLILMPADGGWVLTKVNSTAKPQ